MSTLDGSIVVIGLPTILQKLNATIVEACYTGYKLMDDVFNPVWTLADMYGRVKLYNMGFVIFTVGSLFALLSQNGGQLVAFRFLKVLGLPYSWQIASLLSPMLSPKRS